VFEGSPALCYDDWWKVEINVLVEEDFQGQVDVGWLQRVAEQALVAQGADPRSELGLVIAGEETVRELNQRYLGRDEPTDVLAFGLLPGVGEEGALPFVPPPDGIPHLGEVIISYPQALAQAREQRHSVEREMAILLIHGILHLLGYDHDTPELEEVMRTREKEILEQVERGD